MIKNEIIVKSNHLNDLYRAFSSRGYTRLGILKGKTTRTPEAGEKKSGLTNATLGVIHEFGSKTNKIPARSFLRMPIQYKAKEIAKNIFAVKKQIEQDISRGNVSSFLNELGIACLQAVNDAFTSHGFGQWKPNKPETIRRKGSSMPLIDTSSLRSSITFQVVKDAV